MISNAQQQERPRVLSLGSDPTLLRSRQFVLQDAGFDVISNIDIEHTVPDFDYQVSASVLCHSIPLERRLKLAATARDLMPRAGVVFIYYGQETFDARDIDTVIRTPVAPADLVGAVRRAIKKAEARTRGNI